MELMARLSRSEAKRALQDRQRSWLKWVIEKTGKVPAQIGREAEVSDTPLTRLLNNPEYTGALSELTIERIMHAFGLPGPSEYRRPQGAPALTAEAEAVHVAPADLPQRARDALSLLADSNDAVEVWRLATSNLEGAGYIAGDLLLLDGNATPAPHEVVCALIRRDGEQERVWRLYDPPFLLAAPGRAVPIKPVLVDGDRVKLCGVVIASVRPRRLPTAP